MSDLVKKFDKLGYDLLELDSLVYLSLDPDSSPDDCHLVCVECDPSCVSCKKGCPNGPN